MSDPQQSPKLMNAVFVSVWVAICANNVAMVYETPLIVKLSQHYGVRDSDLGQLLAVTLVIMSVMQLVWGYWTDKFSRIRLMAISLFIITACALLTGVSLVLNMPFAVFAGLKLASGIGLAAIGPVIGSVIMDAVPATKRSSAFGWIGLAWGIGGGLGPLMASFCVDQGLGLSGAYLAAAVLCLGSAILALCTREPERGAQDEAIRELVAGGEAHYAYRIRPSDFPLILRKPANLLVGGATMLYQLPVQLLGFWFITYMMRQHGVNEMQATTMFLIAFAGQPLGNIIGGILSDRVAGRGERQRLSFMIAMAIMAQITLVAALVLPLHVWVFLALMLVANAFISGGGPGLSTIGLEINLPEHRGVFSALMGLITNIVQAFSWWLPPLIAASFGGDYGKSFLICTAVFLPLVGLYLVVARRIGRDIAAVGAVLQTRAGELSRPPAEDSDNQTATRPL